MRIFIILIVISCLFGCKNKADKQIVATKQRKAVVIKNNSIAKQIEPQEPDFPADTIYPARILTGGGVFHEDEVDLIHLSISGWESLKQIPVIISAQHKLS
jgi:hypothetical protein